MDDAADPLVELSEKIGDKITRREEISETTLEIEPENDEFPFVTSADERLRCFIVREMASSDIDGTIMVQNMDKVFKWVTTGKVPRMTYVKGKAVEVVE
jgi:hypothetical protein